MTSETLPAMSLRRVKRMSTRSSNHVPKDLETAFRDAPVKLETSRNVPRLQGEAIQP